MLSHVLYSHPVPWPAGTVKVPAYVYEAANGNRLVSILTFTWRLAGDVTVVGIDDVS
jgi:hypothetical protein